MKNMAFYHPKSLEKRLDIWLTCTVYETQQIFKPCVYFYIFFKRFQSEIFDASQQLISAVDFYFVQEDGARFKASLPFKPYLYILPKKDCLQEVSSFLGKKYSGIISSIEPCIKEDLDLVKILKFLFCYVFTIFLFYSQPNHLVGLKQNYLKLSFLTVTDLMKVRKDIMPHARKNIAKTNTAYSDLMANYSESSAAQGEFTGKKISDVMDNIIDIRY